MVVPNTGIPVEYTERRHGATPLVRCHECRLHTYFWRCDGFLKHSSALRLAVVIPLRRGRLRALGRNGYVRRRLSRAIFARDLRVLVTAGASGSPASPPGSFASAEAKVHITVFDEAAAAGAVFRVFCLAGTAEHILAEGRRSRSRRRSRAIRGLDVLVNSVGVPRPTGAVWDCSDRTSSKRSASASSLVSTFSPAASRCSRGSRRNRSIIEIASDLARNSIGQNISVDGHVERL